MVTWGREGMGGDRDSDGSHPLERSRLRRGLHRRLRWPDVVLVLVVIALFYANGPRPVGRVVSVIQAEVATLRAQAAIRREWLRLVGDEGGGDVLVAFVDYQCPACRQLPGVTDQLRARGIRVIVRQLPLSSLHSQAMAAAVAAICAEEQGHFTAAHRALLETWSAEGLESPAGALASMGIVDPLRMQECIVSDDVRDRLAYDGEVAASLGIRGTPTFVGQRGIHLGHADLGALVSLAR